MPRLLAIVRPSLGDLDGPALGSLLWACGRLGIRDEDLLRDAMQLIVQKPRLLPPREIATCVWALVQLEWSPPVAVRLCPLHVSRAWRVPTG